MNWSQDFTVKSNARRAARKAGIAVDAVQAFVKAGKKLFRFPLAPPKVAKPKTAKPTKVKAAAKAKTPKPAKAKARPPRPSHPASRAPRTTPSGGKFDQVASMLRRAGGASMTEIVAITNWKPHSARARISVDVAKLLNKGETIERRRENGVSHYAIVASKQMDLPIPQPETV